MLDCMVVCVDRRSGWVVAIPELYNGLTWVKVAKSMLKFQWRPFQIPMKKTSDQGPHFQRMVENHVCPVGHQSHLYPTIPSPSEWRSRNGRPTNCRGVKKHSFG